MPSDLIPEKAYGMLPIALKNCASVMTLCHVKLLRPCQSTSIFPFVPEIDLH